MRRRCLRSLLRKNFIELEDVQTDRDPLRSAAERLRVHSPGQWPEGKLKKAERELLSYLELHPGSHNLAEVDEAVKGASEAARALARRKILVLEVEAPAMRRPTLQAAANAEPPSGSGVSSYSRGGRVEEFPCVLVARRDGLRQDGGLPNGDRSNAGARPKCAAAGAGNRADAAVAGQFFHRFGDRVAILHSAFTMRSAPSNGGASASGRARGGRDTIRRLRAGAKSRPHHRRRRARRQL